MHTGKPHSHPSPHGRSFTQEKSCISSCLSSTSDPEGSLWSILSPQIWICTFPHTFRVPTRASDTSQKGTHKCAKDVGKQYRYLLSKCDLQEAHSLTRRSLSGCFGRRNAPTPRSTPNTPRDQACLPHAQTGAPAGPRAQYQPLLLVHPRSPRQHHPRGGGARPGQAREDAAHPAVC